VSLVALTARCDAGTQTNASLGIGPPIHVVGFNGSTGTIPADGTIQIAFDRLLHPASVTRQSFSLVDESGNFPEEVVTYDPVARVVSLSTPNPSQPGPWLTPARTYTITIGVSAQDDYTGGSGPRAIDGAVLPAQVVETFQAGPAPTPDTPPADRPIDFCNDVLPIFQLRCSGSLCHAAPLGPTLPAEGLILQTADGISNTAIGRVSQESNMGPLAGTPQVQGQPFGVDMGIVTPGDPGSSWLMYKVLLGQLRPVDQGLDAGIATCGSAGAPASVDQLPTPLPQPAATLMLPASEQAILSEYILGNQMPYPLNLPASEQTPVSGTDNESSTLPLTFDELERVRAWIAEGANVTECTACP
jgi:hypothetical protein